MFTRFVRETALACALCTAPWMIGCGTDAGSGSEVASEPGRDEAAVGVRGFAELGGRASPAQMVQANASRAVEVHEPFVPAERRAALASNRALDLESLREKPRFGELDRIASTAIPSPPPELTFRATGTSGTPPDTMGSVGPNHVVTIINFRVVIQTRTGTTLSEVDLDTFFGSVIPPDNDGFDPRAAYDTFSNRWILHCPSGVGFRQNSTNLLAVSETSDPTGAWNFYAFPADPEGLRWADHNGLGFNSKWIVIHANMVPLESADSRQHFWAIDKAALYGGATSVPYTLLVGDGWQSTPAVTYDATEPDLYLLETTCGNCSGSGEMRLRRITGAVGSEVLQTVGTVTTPAWGGGLFVPQQGSSSTVNFTLDWIQNVVVRNGSLWATHQVGLPASAPTHVAVRWLELDPSPAISVLQTGTLEDPSGTNHYGYPSIAVNTNNDVLIGYSRSSALQFVSANYAARAASDPPGTLRDDTLFKAGEAPYDNGRWGDYSNTVIDPVDGLTMWTIQQAADAPGNTNYDLWWAKVPPPGAAPACSVATATDLGPRTTLTTVPSNACVKISQYPSWWQFTNGLTTLQSGNGTFPVPASWTDSCTSATGSTTFTTSWQSRTIGNHAASCPVVIQLSGSGAPLQLTWW